MKQYPPIQLVDENDQPIGGASMDEIHQKGLLHRVVHIFVEDEAGNILLQKRGPNVATHPGLWDISAGGHVDEGEDYKFAATRELSEELGIVGYELETVEKHLRNTTFKHRLLNRFVTVFKVIVPVGIDIKYPETEVIDIKWLSLQNLRELIKSDPETFTPELIRLFNKLYR